MAQADTLCRAAQVLAADRQAAQPLSGRREDRISHRRLDHGRARLADATPFLAGGWRGIELGLWRLLEANHPIGVEVALNDTRVLDGDLAEQRCREAVDHPALELRLDATRVDHHAAIASDDDALDLDLAVRHRDLGDHPDDRLVAVVDG